jgi:pleiotropic regulator 1
MSNSELKQKLIHSQKRTIEIFKNSQDSLYNEPQSQKLRLSVKISDDYGTMIKKKKSVKPTEKPELIIEDIKEEKALMLVESKRQQQAVTLMEQRKRYEESMKPTWHAPWKLSRVISGHVGWVRCLAVDTSNEWFASGSVDRTIKIFDLATGVLKLTLTGHISTVRGLAIHDKRPYLFSVGEDKQVKQWDLEQNKVIHSYYGSLKAVYCVAVHPTLDLLFTGGRDNVVRVWDMRSKNQVHAFAGHTGAVCSIAAQALEPQVISGSIDGTLRCWDIVAGKSKSVLTNHKKSVRSIVVHPTEYTWVSGAADHLKKWKGPDGQFLMNFNGHNGLVNSMALNHENILVSAADDGSMYMWDYKTGYNFQKIQTIPQSGSLDSESGIFCVKFDQSGSRMLTAEADKTIKVWKEDSDATPETHPVEYTPDPNNKRY